MTGLEIGAVLLGKFLIGKAITYAGGHILAGASASTLSHLGMQAAINTTGSALAAGTLAGGAVAMGHGLWTVKSFTEEVNSRKRKNNWKDAGALDRVKGTMTETLVAVVFQIVEDKYKGCEVKDEDGKPKTTLLQIRKCTRSDCECLDFNLREEGPTRLARASECDCGHGGASHQTASDHNTKDIALVILFLLADHVYPKLSRKTSKGIAKTSMDQAEHCKTCGCTDFQFEWGTHCQCGHDGLEHVAIRSTVSRGSKRRLLRSSPSSSIGNCGIATGRRRPN